MALDRQINLFKVDTNAFLKNEEKEIIKNVNDRLKPLKEELEPLIKEKEEYEKEKVKLEKLISDMDKDDINIIDFSNRLEEVESELRLDNSLIRYIKKDINWFNNYKKDMLSLMFMRQVTLNKMRDNKVIRELDESYLSYFDESTQTRRPNLNNIISNLTKKCKNKNLNPKL